jgi:hypothetical protein
VERRRTGVPGLTESQLAEVRALAAASATAQGLPAKVEDRRILQQVAALVRPSLAAPDEADPGRVEGLATGCSGPDHSVVEDGGDDRGLAA